VLPGREALRESREALRETGRIFKVDATGARLLRHRLHERHGDQ